jgi:lipase
VRVRLNIHEWGSANAPTVVCLHGVQAYGRRFRRLAEEQLVPAGYRVLGIDLRGHADSSWAPPWSIEQHVEDVVDTLEGPVTSLGHSFGGRMVLEVAARHPALVERAVLLDPALHVPPARAFESANAELGDLSYATPEDAMADIAAAAPRTPRDFLEEEVASHLRLGDDGRWRYRYAPAAVATMFGDLARPAPPAARCPTLVVVGEETDYVRTEDLAPLGADVVYVPGGHRVLFEAFDETAYAVLAFLRSN